MGVSQANTKSERMLLIKLLPAVLLLSKTVSTCKLNRRTLKIENLKGQEGLRGLRVPEIKEKFAEVDGDGDGCVTWAEVEAAQAKNPVVTADEGSFKMLDTDKSDCITLEELATLWKEKIPEHMSVNVNVKVSE